MSLRFRNPMTRSQILLTALSIPLLIFYSFFDVTVNFDGDTCQFMDTQYKLGLGWFMFQFIIFIVMVDL